MKDDATLRQIAAANPRASTWVSANAGSGKTRVLTDRVARLLLDKVDPSHILCLTYTKAAAAEMQNRLFKRLGEWAMMPDDKLRQNLQDMGVEGGLTTEELADARRLFATAIEVPGGLRIQTIHSFCSSILRRFPLEASVSPQFAEMEDRAAELLRAEVLDQIAEGPDAQVIDAVAKHVSDDQLMALAKDVLRFKDDFQRDVTRDDLAAGFGLPAGAQPSDAISIALIGGEDALAEEIVQCAASTTDTYKKFATTLKSLDYKNPDFSLLSTLFSEFLYSGKNTSKSVNYPQSNHTKAVEAFAPVIDDLHAWMDRTAAAFQHLKGCAALDRTMLLYDFAKVFIPAYENRKVQRGLLDFDDLILKTRDLLKRSEVAEWVLFKLDGGIDHILVDEAQDTSPAQWDVVKALAGEFAAGEGARADQQRTIFVVGDKKQSIYSFQGADPEKFDDMRLYFDAALENTETPLNTTELQYSFRSSHAILSFVDHAFTGDLAEGLNDEVIHSAFKSEMPGRVDLWPFVEKTEKPEKNDWHDPHDLVSDEEADVQLSQSIAQNIKVILETETIPAENGKTGTYHRRPVRPGDILILVQRRKTLFNEIIRACKDLNLPIAGADRLILNDQLAVKDILALLRFVALAEDDLSLAAALKSPLFGWSEQDLFTLAYGRKGYLWEALRHQTEQHGKTLAVLDDLRKRADFLRPYDLIERILTRHGGRKALVGQLGAEAEDAIDALLSQALSYEQGTVPSLTGFLHWMEAEDVTVKRQMDGDSDEIRVMTVHGSKGLEAPIVILPETQTRDVKARGSILKSEVGPIWRPLSEETPEAIAPLIDDAKAAEIRERRRLLYVALTRAEKWLILCGAGDVKDNTEAWYDIVGSAMEHMGAETVPFGGMDILRYSVHDWSGLELNSTSEEPKATITIPDLPVVDAPPQRASTISPSDLGGAKALAGEIIDGDKEVALARGRVVHMLLEHLPSHPESERSRIGQALMAGDEDIGLVDDRDKLLDDVIAMLDNPDLAAVFASDTLAEVEITAELSELGGRIHGAIDRLIISDDRVTCVDFKTNRIVPDQPEQTPEGVLRQMGAYHAALSQIYPDRQIDCAILWTATGKLMNLSSEIVMAALRRAATT
jgi:ATP-dependent helicase/nuclease subunit A